MQFIFIGDVHGGIDEFRELARRADVRSVDRSIGLGDLMDKGPARERAFDAPSSWALLRETFEYRDFDDSLVFAE